jgi:hypothetical protein
MMGTAASRRLIRPDRIRPLPVALMVLFRDRGLQRDRTIG